MDRPTFTFGAFSDMRLATSHGKPLLPPMSYHGSTTTILFYPYPRGLSTAPSLTVSGYSWLFLTSARMSLSQSTMFLSDLVDPLSRTPQPIPPCDLLFVQDDGLAVWPIYPEDSWVIFLLIRNA